MKSRRVIRRVLLGSLWLLAYLAVLGAAVMVLWNALIPDLFQGPALTYVQAIGLLVLAHLLSRRGFFYGGPGWRYRHWRHKWRPTSDSKCGNQRSGAEENPEQREAVEMSETKIGTVTHYFDHLHVAAVSLTDGDLREGDTIHVKGHTTDFQQTVVSMQIDNQPVDTAKAGQSVGIEVIEHAREHDSVYKVT